MQRTRSNPFFNASVLLGRAAVAFLICMGLAHGQSADGSGTRKIKPPAKPAVETRIVPGDTMPRGKSCKRTRVPKPIRVKEDKACPQCKKDAKAMEATDQ